MPRGGRRPGAGRPRKEDAKRRQPGPVRVAEEAFRDALPELAKVALRLAIEEGNERMLIYCIDRALGKPTQPVDLVDRVRDLAVVEGLTEAEAAEAVAEAERLLRASRGTRS